MEKKEKVHDWTRTTKFSKPPDILTFNTVCCSDKQHRGCRQALRLISLQHPNKSKQLRRKNKAQIENSGGILVKEERRVTKQAHASASMGFGDLRRN